MKKRPGISAIVPAAGIGARMKSDKKKQFLEIEGKPIIAYTLEVLSASPFVDEIIVATGEEDILFLWDIIREFEIGKVKSVITGGATRQESVSKGVFEAENEYVMIHDGVRPLVTLAEIEAAAIAGFVFGASAVGVPLADTVKLADGEGKIIKTLDREGVYRIFTPQVIKKELYLKGLEAAKEKGIVATDDLGIAELAGASPKIAPGNPMNIKITAPADLEIAGRLLKG